MTPASASGCKPQTPTPSVPPGAEWPIVAESGWRVGGFTFLLGFLRFLLGFYSFRFFCWFLLGEVFCFFWLLGFWVFVGGLFFWKDCEAICIDLVKQ